MNLPNKLTISRIVLIPIFMLFAFPLGLPAAISGSAVGTIYANIADTVAFVIFIVASATDALDGHIARKFNLITDFGKFLDPIADKLLVTAALLALCGKNKMYVWATMIILIREFVVTGMRLVAGTKGKVIAAGTLGKLKTVSQTIALAILLAAPMFSGFGLTAFGGVLQIVGDVILCIAVVLTIVSGVQYLVVNRSVFKE